MRKFFVLTVIAVLFPTLAFGLTNGDFEAGNLSGWTTSFGVAGSSSSVNVVAAGAFAPYTNNLLSKTFSGNFAAEIYSGFGGMDHYSYARIEQNVVVPAGFTSLEMYFAAVLNTIHFTGGGAVGDDAYVLMEIYNGATQIYSQRFSSYDNVFLLQDGVAGDDWKFLPWQRISVPLAAYVGSTLTVRYTAYDCAPSGHFCYGYIDGMKFSLPDVLVTKTLDKDVVMINDIITYCFNYTNPAVDPITFSIWDTLPAEVDFVDCTGGCTNTMVGGNAYVVWGPLTTGAGASGSVCVRARVARQP